MFSLLDRVRYSTRQTPPVAIAIWLVLVLTVFFGPLDISSDAQTMTVGLDGQVACKLVVAGFATLLGVYGLLASASVRQTLTTIPPLMVAGILLLAGLATPIAISSTSLPTTLINFGYLAFMVTAMLTLRLRGIATAVLAGVVITMSVALTFYFFVPKFGLFPELLADGLVVLRMSGTAHPNAVGRAMMLGLILTLYLYRTGTLTAQVAVPIAAVLAMSAFLAWSRTAIAAGTFGLVILYLDKLFSRTGAAAVALAGVLGIAGLTMVYVTGYEDHVVGRVLSKVSKSGDAEEITSGTGRAEIWTKAASLIASRPVIGHGFSAAPSLMIDHSQATHNAVLHATLSAGIGGGLLMLCLLLWNCFLIFSCDNLLVRALSAFIVLSCVTEDTVLETFPGPCTVAWMMCLFYPVMVRVPGKHPAFQWRRSMTEASNGNGHSDHSPELNGLASADVLPAQPGTSQ